MSYRTQPPRASSLLSQLRVASPCPVDWGSMVGDDRVRHCQECNKRVYNVSAMTRDEAEAFLREATDMPCVRLLRRRDGTVSTTDCPDQRNRRVAKVILSLQGGGIALVVTKIIVAFHAFLSAPRASEPMQGVISVGPMASTSELTPLRSAPAARNDGTRGATSAERAARR